MITRINDVTYRIQRHPRAKMIVLHLDKLASFLGATQDEQWGQCRGNSKKNHCFKRFTFIQFLPCYAISKQEIVRASVQCNYTSTPEILQI
jgi:hypothetical protein